MPPLRDFGETVNNVATIMAETVNLLTIVRRQPLPILILDRTDRLLKMLGSMGDEIVAELADSGHCKVFIDCGEHEYAWDCRIKRGEPCRFNHRLRQSGQLNP